jgi:hypothetical protein
MSPAQREGHVLVTCYSMLSRVGDPVLRHPSRRSARPGSDGTVFKGNMAQDYAGVITVSPGKGVL